MSKPLCFALLVTFAVLICTSCAPHSESQTSLLPSSRMKPDISNADLLYVSNSNGEVTVYRYWQHTLVGVLTDFTKPMGECVDAAQNVYITDAGAHQIVEYAHGGSKPIGKIDDSPDSPYACAVDPSTGNLAVANDDGASVQGNIAIWNPSRQRTNFTDSKLYNFQGCAYDNNGALLVTNGYVAYPNKTYFAWLPKGGRKLVDVNIPNGYNDNWGDVYGIQWDGRYFAIDTPERIYRIMFNHAQGYFIGYADFAYSNESSTGPYALYIKPGGEATQAVEGMDAFSGSGIVAYWQYPAGGNAIASLSHGIDKPFGVAISLKH